MVNTTTLLKCKRLFKNFSLDATSDCFKRQFDDASQIYLVKKTRRDHVDILFQMDCSYVVGKAGEFLEATMSVVTSDVIVEVLNKEGKVVITQLTSDNKIRFRNSLIYEIEC